MWRGCDVQYLTNTDLAVERGCILIDGGTYRYRFMACGLHQKDASDRESGCTLGRGSPPPPSTPVSRQLETPHIHAPDFRMTGSRVHRSLLFDGVHPARGVYMES
jgi:hypothetical protein